MTTFWNALSSYYTLCPKEGVIQLEMGQVCVIPKEIIPTGLKSYFYNDWVDVPFGANFYPILHCSISWPLPTIVEKDILFVLSYDNVPVFLDDEKFLLDTIKIVNYALIRE